KNIYAYIVECISYKVSSIQIKGEMSMKFVLGALIRKKNTTLTVIFLIVMTFFLLHLQVSSKIPDVATLPV
ncbi:hypothetical protein ACFL47_10875, partial [Candidatus Latescibacterota bacterium]